MNKSPQSLPSALPSRPHTAVSYRPVGRLADLAAPFRFASPPSEEGGADSAETLTNPPLTAEIVDFALTPPLGPGRRADTWSWGVLKLVGRPPLPACTTFDRRSGCLVLETARIAVLSPAELSAVARAFVKGHILCRARQTRRGAGRN